MQMTAQAKQRPASTGLRAIGGEGMLRTWLDKKKKLEKKKPR
jgi:hypothetical protein